MTWRRFRVLVRGLSVNSTLVRVRVQEERAGTRVVTMRTPEQAQRAFVSMFSSLGRRRTRRGGPRTTVGPLGEKAEKTPTN